MDQYSPTYSNDRAAKDQTALLISLIALLAAALVVVFVLGQQGPAVSAKELTVATPVAEMQKPVTAMVGTALGVLVAPADGPVSLIGGPASTTYPALSGRITAMLQTELGLWAGLAASGDAPAEIVLVRNGVAATPFIQHISLPAGVAGAEIRAFASGLGRVWVGTSKGLLEYGADKFASYSPPSRYRLPGMSQLLDVTALYLDATSTLWIGTKDGLLSYNGTEAFRHTVKEGLPDNAITTLTGDQTGLLYVGTERGLAVFDHGNWVRQSELNDRVNAVLAAEDNVWVASADGLYQRLDGKWLQLGKDSKLPEGNVSGLAWAPDGVYASLESGVQKLSVVTAVATAEKEGAAKHEGAATHEGPSAPEHHEK